MKKLFKRGIIAALIETSSFFFFFLLVELIAVPHRTRSRLLKCVWTGRTKSLQIDTVIDLLILLSKFDLHKCKLQNAVPVVGVFSNTIRSRFNIETYSAYIQGNDIKFNAQWLRNLTKRWYVMIETDLPPPTIPTVHVSTTETMLLLTRGRSHSLSDLRMFVTILY